MRHLAESPKDDMPPRSVASNAAASTETMESGTTPDVSDDESTGPPIKSRRAREPQSPDGSASASDSESPAKAESATEGTGETPSMPVQKRRRVTRACGGSRARTVPTYACAMSTMP